MLASELQEKNYENEPKKNYREPAYHQAEVIDIDGRQVPVLHERLGFQQECGPLARAVPLSSGRYVSASTLIMHWMDGEPAIFDFITKHTIAATQDITDLISVFFETSTFQNAVRLLPEIDPDDLQSLVDELVALGFLFEGDARSNNLFDRWKWSLPSAIFHFSANNCRFASRHEAEEIQLSRIELEPQPELFKTNVEYDNVIELPALDTDPTICSMSKRRTCRDFSERAIDRKQLAKCLYAGLGITGWTSNCVGRLPLKMTPSGGARNPFEAFVLVRNVKELEPDLYHYSALEHSLGKLNEPHLPLPSDVLASQDWTNGASCIVFLCANFERSMWKYRDNNAYRVMLIEAGHIAQNMMLAATDEGFAASPTAALAHDEISQLIGCSDPLTSPIYALAIGYS